MFTTRCGVKLLAQSKPKRKRKGKPALRGILKPLPTEIPVDWLQNQLVSITPLSVTHAYGFKWEYLCTELLSKLPESGVSSDIRRDRAIDKTLETEDACAYANAIGYDHLGFSFSAQRFGTILNYAADIINDICGDLDYGIFRMSKFSSGASTSRRRVKGDSYFKYKTKGNPVHVTPGALPYAIALIENTPMWHTQGVQLELTPGNRVTTVPKKTDIDRTIAMEPDVNMALQLAVGAHLRRSLKSVAGIDLNDQSRNQRLAKRGSITGCLATIDLSSASDSISYQLVRRLLPREWFSLLDDLRSPVGVLPDGSTITWEKFSSMGNGFTFELESMIFYALTLATVLYERGSQRQTYWSKHYDISVYGDDIICPTSNATNVIEVLAQAGFKTNLEKTFITGPFRESCGKHYYAGIDVTPFYVRKPIDHPVRVIWLLNKLRLWAYDEDLNICDPTSYDLWRYVLKKYAPSRLRGGKDVYSDSSIASPGHQGDKLVPAMDRFKLRGVSAVLRWFQTANQYADSGCDVRVYPTSFEDLKQPWSFKEVRLDIERTHLCVPFIGLFRYVPNKEPNRFLPLFSQEIM